MYDYRIPLRERLFLPLTLPIILTFRKSPNHFDFSPWSKFPSFNTYNTYTVIFFCFLFELVPGQVVRLKDTKLQKGVEKGSLYW